LKRTFLPEKREWVASVKTALAKNLGKVVLARCEILELEREPDPFALTAALKERSSGAYLFCFSEGDTAFLGASPERLFSRSQNTLYTEAVAGTVPRGKTPEEDSRLGEALLKSEKALRELAPVQAFFQKVLPPPLTFSPISLHKTQNVQHLYMRCSASVPDNLPDSELLSRLHPTPALCGTPTDKAFALISELEPFERGLYGGAIGWSTPETSEWIVGIRCCLIKGKRAYLYTGAGIVEGSDPEEEWEELNHKRRLYDGIFL
jgi:menaquinone-specific isochorismate synthase